MVEKSSNIHVHLTRIHFVVPDNSNTASVLNNQLISEYIAVLHSLHKFLIPQHFLRQDCKAEAYLEQRFCILNLSRTITSIASYSRMPDITFVREIPEQAAYSTLKHLM